MIKTAELLIEDRAVAVAAAVAFLLVAALVAAALARGRALPVPTVTIVVLSLVAAVPGAEANPDRYRAGPVEPHPWWMLVLLVAALLCFAVVAAGQRTSASGRERLTLALAAISVGLFLAVPETGVLRLVVAPLLLIGVAVAWRRLPPFGPAATVLLAVGLAWVTVVDGAAESTSALGLVVALLLASLVPTFGPDTEGDRRRLAPLAAALAAIVIGARVVGTAASGSIALGYGAVIAMSALAISMTGNRSGARH